MNEVGEPPSQPDRARPGRRGPLRRWGLVALRLLVPVVVIWLVWGELTGLDWPQVRAEMADANFLLLVTASVVVAANVAAMGLYDAVSFPGTPRLGFNKRWGLGALCFAWSNFLTIGPIGGPALRFLVYGRRGLSAAQVARGLGAQYMGFAGGLIGWLCASLLPVSGLAGLAIRAAFALTLAIGLTIVIRLIVLRILERRAKGRHQHAEPAEPAGGAIEQFRRTRPAALGVVGFLDWGLSLLAFSMVAWAVGMPLAASTAAKTFLGGHLVGMISMLPGGLGSADASWLYGLTESGFEPDVAAAGILLFRVVFYLLPWVIAAAITLTIAGPRFEEASAWRPHVLGMLVVVYAGIVLSALALPATGIWPMARPLPPTIVVNQATHLFGLIAIVGAACQVPGILARSRRSWRFALAFMALGLVSHAIKGDDIQEVLVSALVMVLAYAARHAMDQPGVVRTAWWVPGAIVSACTAMYWLVGIQSFPRGTLDAWDLVVFGTAQGAGRFLRGGVFLVFVSLAMFAYEGVRVMLAGNREA